MHNIIYHRDVQTYPLFFTGYRLAAEVNRQHSECVCTIYTHTLRVLPIHFGRETVHRSESAALGVCVYYIYTHTPSAADSLRPRDGTQCFSCPLPRPFFAFRPALICLVRTRTLAFLFLVLVLCKLNLFS